MLHLPRKVTLQLHQILRLPRKMTFKIHRAHIWNVIYNARSNRHHPPTSPNTAPATQNDSHDWSSSHMERHLQCAEQQASPSNLTKYCACHAKWLSPLIPVTHETSFTMRGATDVTLQPHQILHLPRKMASIIDPRHIWNVIHNAWGNNCHPPSSPNTAPAKQNDCHDWSLSHMKRHLQCAEQKASPSNLTKYCGKIAFQNLREIVQKQLKCHLQCATDSSMVRAWSDHDPSPTRPFAEVTFRASGTHFVLKITTFRAPAIIPKFTKCCAYHENWHLNFIKCCACHEKWHLNFSKCCTCHEKWHLNFTKYCACHEKWHLNFSKCCACHEKWHLNFSKYCACHEKWHLNFTKCCACHETLLLLDSSIPWLFFYLTLLLLDSSLLDSTIFYLFGYLTILLLDSTIT